MNSHTHTKISKGFDIDFEGQLIRIEGNVRKKKGETVVGVHTMPKVHYRLSVPI